MRIMLERATVLFLFAFIATGQLPAAPRQNGSENPTIRVNSHLVLVPVSVTDASGQAVKDLKLEDFSVFENGSPVPLARISDPGGTRLEIALLFDISGSVHSRFQFELEAAARFVQSLFRAGDTVSILSIGLQPVLVQEKTVSLPGALKTLRTLSPTGEPTSFYDCVAAAAQSLEDSPDPDARRVQVILSDGQDNCSRYFDLAGAIREVQQSDCIFYAINPRGESNLSKISREGQANLQVLASETGGAAFLAKGVEDLDPIFSRISAELQAQYLLAYYSSNDTMDGSFRRILVEVPARPSLRVRARQGYYATRAPSSEGAAHAGAEKQRAATNP